MKQATPLQDALKIYELKNSLEEIARSEKRTVESFTLSELCSTAENLLDIMWDWENTPAICGQRRRLKNFLEKWKAIKKTTHVVSLSGGKDSTAMLLMMLEKKMPIDYIIYADTGKEFPQMQKHLQDLAEYIKEKYPTAPPITVLHPPRSFDWYIFEQTKKNEDGKTQKGYGWASMRCRWCTSEVKTRPIKAFCNRILGRVISYIGIAADETKRLSKNNGVKARYPLAEWGITENQALEYCYSQGFTWDGLYRIFKRVSCWCCPLKSIKELKALYDRFPELWARLREMDERSPVKRSPSIEELEERFKKYDAQEVLAKNETGRT